MIRSDTLHSSIAACAVLVLLQFAPVVSVAQELVEEEAKRAPVGPPILYGGYYWNSEDSFDGGGSLTANEALIRLPLFIIGRDKDFFITGSARYEYANLTFSEFDLIPDTDFHEMRLRLTTYWEPRDKPWFAQFRIEPGIYTEGSDISTDDYQSRGFGAFGYEFSSTFRMFIGAYYTESFGDARLIPAPGLVWTPNDSFTLHIAPPEPRITYYPTPDWALQLKFLPAGGSWNVDNSTSDIVDQFIFSKFRLGAGIERRIYKNLWATVWGGANLFQNVEVQDDGERVLFEEDLDNGYFIYAGFHISAW